MHSIRHRHLSLWTRINRRLWRKVERQREKSIACGNLSDRGLSRPLTDSMASATIRALGHRIGIDPLHLATDTWLGDDMIRTCAACKNRGECRLWLADYDADKNEYKNFCPNAKRFRKLM